MQILKDAAIRKDRRRILLLSFHFPPAQTAGALRWQKLATPLADAGWSLDVVTNDPGVLTESGRRVLDELPPGTRILGVPEGLVRTQRYARSLSARLRAIRPSGATSSAGVGAGGQPRPGSLHRTEIRWRPFRESLRRAYGAAFRLNLDRGWAKAAERAATALIESAEADYDAIVTCGPPHLVHLTGLRLHRRSGIPFIMDTRDPWRFVERLPEAIASPVWLGVSRFFEERCVREAALVVTNTEPAAELMRRKYPGKGPFLAVRNGSDLVRPVAGSRSGAFIVAFAGSIYLDRDPRPLFEAAARLVSKRELTPEDLRIVLVGNVQEYEGQPVRDLAASEGVAEHVELLASVPREDLVAILEQASILFSLPQDSHLAIPSKIYEYAEYPAWLLAVAEPQSATGKLLAKTGADVVEPGSSDGIFEILDRRYSDYLAGRQPRALAEDPRFRRSTQADRLMTALKAITGSP